MPTTVDSAIALPDSRGVIFGSLYIDRPIGLLLWSPPVRIHSLSSEESEVIVHSKGQSLVRDYWGYYVAVLVYPEHHSNCLLRAA